MIRMKIAFVLRLTDDFSGRDITEKGFRFYIGDRVVKPVEKAEGLYVFLEPKELQTRVIIESTQYYPCSVMIDKSILNPQEPVAEVRLYRKPGKMASPGVELLTGVIQDAGQFPAEIYAKKSSPAGVVLKEAVNDEGECRIWFSGYTKENLLGKTWILDDTEEPLLLILQEKRGINEYRAEIIQGEPEKIRSGTPLYRIYRTVTDHRGAYAIPVESGEETKDLKVETLCKHRKIRKEGD